MKISIITVCKNPGVSLKKTAESIMSQVYNNIEYIVVDGASDDNTGKYLKEVPDRGSEKSFKFISEPDTGIYNAMNKGIRIAEGEFLLFLNAGDYLVDENTVSEVVRVIDADSMSGDIYFGSIFSEDHVTGMKRYVSGGFRHASAAKFFFWSIPHPAVFIKKEFLNKAGGYDESFRISADYDFFVRSFIIEKADMKYIPVTVSVFRTDGISSDKRYSDIIKSENLRIIQKYYGPFAKFLYNSKIFVILRFLFKVWLRFEKHD